VRRGRTRRKVQSSLNLGCGAARLHADSHLSHDSAGSAGLPLRHFRRGLAPHCTSQRTLREQIRKQGGLGLLARRGIVFRTPHSFHGAAYSSTPGRAFQDRFIY
jgi:hypothetical protein